MHTQEPDKAHAVTVAIPAITVRIALPAAATDTIDPLDLAEWLGAELYPTLSVQASTQGGPATSPDLHVIDLHLAPFGHDPVAGGLRLIRLEKALHLIKGRVAQYLAEEAPAFTIAS